MKSGKSSSDYGKYCETLDQLFHSIANGHEKWQKPWKEGEIKLPFNAATGRPYSGCNGVFFSRENRNAGFLTFSK